MAKDEGQSDFALIYGGGAPVPPRMAAHLWSTALFISDTYRDGDQLDLLGQQLPPVARRLTDDAWMRRFVSSFDALAYRLASGRFASEQLASCTAEEMTLHLVIDLAEDFVADGMFPPQDHPPAYGEADTDFESAARSCSATTTCWCCSTPPWTGSRTTPTKSARTSASPTFTHGDWFVTF